jgi:hypothetical protein
MRLPKVKTGERVRDPYARRLLSYLEGKDPQRILASGPRELRNAVRGLSAAELRFRPAPGKWPIGWLAHHMCDAEVALGLRIRFILGRNGARVQAYDQDSWASSLHYDRRSVRESVSLYAALRRSHLEILRLASRAELRRYGVHEERGRETVGRLLQLMAGHDLNHLRQIRAIRAHLGKR